MAEIAQCSSDAEKSDKNVSVHALRTKTRTILSTLLNPVKVLPSDTGLPRDWRGLAELVCIGGERIPQMRNDSDPTVKVLNLWCDADRNNSTVAKLLEYLETLDRFDVIDDVTPLIDEDISVYNSRLANSQLTHRPTSLSSDTTILTVDDLPRIPNGLEPQHYDAFVLFADDDIDFATQLIDTLEKTYNLKLCVKDRDVVGGTIELDVIVRLIAERCNRLVVIISQSFFLSNANKYFVSFAQSIGIEQGKRKIIPCIYSACKIPPELSCYFMLDYTKAGKLWNFWDKLYDSIQVTKPGTRSEVARSGSMQVRRCQMLPSLKHSTSQSNGIRPNRGSNNNNNGDATTTTTHKHENSSTVKFNSAVEIVGAVEGSENGGTQSLNGDSGGSVNGWGDGSGDDKKSKSRMSFLKKLMPKSHKNSRKIPVMETADSTIAAPNAEREKRNFWNRRVKRKAELVN